MARGKRNLPLDEELTKINEQIDTMESALAKLKTRKADLEDKIKQNKLEELYSMISASGKSFDEIKALIGV